MGSPFKIFLSTGSRDIYNDCMTRAPIWLSPGLVTVTIVTAVSIVTVTMVTMVAMITVFTVLQSIYMQKRTRPSRPMMHPWAH